MTTRKKFVPITSHPIDRLALIAGLMFSFSGLAYLLNDHGIVDVSEGAATGGVVILLGVAVLLSILFDTSEQVPMTAGVENNQAPTLFGADADPVTDETSNPDFSWASGTGAGGIAADEAIGTDEAE